MPNQKEGPIVSNTKQVWIVVSVEERDLSGGLVCDVLADRLNARRDKEAGEIVAQVYTKDNTPAGQRPDMIIRYIADGEPQIVVRGETKVKVMVWSPAKTTLEQFEAEVIRRLSPDGVEMAR